MARQLFDLWHDGLRSGDWERLDQAFAVAEQETWFDGSGIAGLRERPRGDNVRTYRAMMDYGPILVLERLDAQHQTESTVSWIDQEPGFDRQDRIRTRQGTHE